MKTVVIADDDFISRSVIKSLIDWRGEGFEIVGEAKNGLEAIDMIASARPDIVLTDMDMPDMNGLEMIRAMRERGLNGAVIVLSAYDDYKYVRSSMKMGAVEYLLKSSVDAQSLLDTLRQACGSGSSPSDYTAQAIKYAQDVQLRQMLLGTLDDSDARRRCLGILGLDGGFYLAVAEIDDFKLISSGMNGGERARLSYAIFDRILGCVADSPCVRVVQMGESVFAFAIKDANACEPARFLSDIRENLYKFMNLTASLCLSDHITSDEGLRRIYEGLLETLKEKLYLGKGLFINAPEPRGNERTEANSLAPEYEKSLNRALAEADGTAAESLLNGLFSSLSRQMAQYSAVRRIGCEIIGIIGVYCRGCDLSEDMIFGVTEPYNRFCLIETIPDMNRFLNDACARYVREARDAGALSEFNPLTSEAVRYMRANFSKPLSLEAVAERVNTNNSYLSRVFKKDTGVNFTVYLNRIRIEQAKRLMSENPTLAVKQVALYCGYVNYNHFFSAFKKATGSSPAAYQQTLSDRRPR